MKKNITFSLALKIILKEIKVMPSIFMNWNRALGGILASDIISKINIPEYNISSRDGFALKSIDTKKACKSKHAFFVLKDKIYAGSYNNSSFKNGDAVEIMTGARIPEGLDSVVPLENVLKIKNKIFIKEKIKKGSYIRKKGIEFKSGQTVLKKGKKIRPSEIAVLASLGYDKVRVIRPPVIGILSTGNELVGISSKKLRGQIRDNNSYSLAAQALSLGCRVNLLGIGLDSLTDIKNIIKKNLRNNDMLIVSGGVSKGKKDFTLKALKSLKADLKFWWVKIKPGRPTAFGMIKNKPIFCVPGTPATSIVVFEKFVKPSILKMMDCKDRIPSFVEARIREQIKVRKGRRYFLRVKLKKVSQGYSAQLSGRQEPVLLNSLIAGQGLLTVLENEQEIKKGSLRKIDILN